MKIFVYGTLMQGRSNHNYYLSSSQFLGVGVLKEYGLYDVSSYPGIQPLTGASVIGELYEVDHETKENLDRLEGEGSLYIATKVTVWQGDTQVRDVLVYVYNLSVEHAPLVPIESQPWKGRGYYE
jgi:gamma-glutamylaminecyclotransferase